SGGRWRSNRTPGSLLRVLVVEAAGRIRDGRTDFSRCQGVSGRRSHLQSVRARRPDDNAASTPRDLNGASGADFDAPGEGSQVGARVARTATTVTFQNLILKLSEFWASQGCTLQQPLDIEIGAGTMHPETFLRVLGPAHWNVAYVQP